MEDKIIVKIEQISTRSVIEETIGIPVEIFKLALATGKIRYNGKSYEIHSTQIGFYEETIVTVK